jgi:hypothetical protein
MELLHSQGDRCSSTGRNPLENKKRRARKQRLCSSWPSRVSGCVGIFGARTGKQHVVVASLFRERVRAPGGGVVASRSTAPRPRSSCWVVTPVLPHAWPLALRHRQTGGGRGGGGVNWEVPTGATKAIKELARQWANFNSRARRASTSLWLRPDSNRHGGADRIVDAACPGIGECGGWLSRLRPCGYQARGGGGGGGVNWEVPTGATTWALSCLITFCSKKSFRSQIRR